MEELLSDVESLKGGKLMLKLFEGQGSFFQVVGEPKI